MSWFHVESAAYSDIRGLAGGIAIPSVDAAKKIADAFEVSLDYLVGEGINASFDKKTLQRLQAIEDMSTDFKTHLFSIIDSVIRDYKTQQAYK